MEKQEMIYLARKFAAKGYDIEKAQYSDDMYGRESFIDEVWEYVTEYHEIGSIEFNRKYREFKLY